MQNSIVSKNFLIQWRNGRAVIFGCIMASCFMLGGVMTNLVLLGYGLSGYLLALCTFAACAVCYKIDQQALRLPEGASQSIESALNLPQQANDSNPRKAA